ncbi:MAG: FGGY-family carbohydrate kinase [Spirochaetia bacterium]|jgi:xylulokinase|nr:FGGY-family carbohydrate kinase [Spirochaetia bacterium]
MESLKPCVLSIDIGTSSMKGGVISLDGELYTFGRVALADTSRNDFLDWDGLIWNRALKSLIQILANKIPLKQLDIKAVVVSGNGPTIVPVGFDGQLIGPGHLWLDKREKRIPGQKSFFLPAVAWIKDNQPGLYEATRSFLGCPEYISYVLTGNSAGFTTNIEFDPYIWTKDGIDIYQLDSEKFPDLINIGDFLGKVTKEAEVSTGIPLGLPVYAGGSDFIMAILGTGAVYPGRTCDRAGTSEGINYCSDIPVENDRIRTLPHVIDGFYNAAGILSSTGAIFEWFRRISGQKNKPYTEMMDEIKQISHEHNIPGFYPSLHKGEVWEFSGGLFVGLEVEHGSAEMGRAVTTAIAYGVKDLIETLEKNNCPIDSLRVSGGQGRSSVWNQMKADVTGKIIEIPSVIDTELMGNACAGLKSTGYFNTLQQASESMVKIVRKHTPDKVENENYNDGYNFYHQRCEDLVKIIQKGELK